jgi:integrase
MPSGWHENVLCREGTRGASWYIRFRDADGRQVKQRLDPAKRWDHVKAQRALGAELDRVKREGWTKPTRDTFGKFADEWERVWVPARSLKPSTRIDYAITLRHARAYFADLPLERIGPEQLDGYVADKIAAGLSAKTVRNHLATLNLVFETARRWKKIRENPLAGVDGPKLTDPETVILTEDEIAELRAAYKLLALDAEPDERPWWDLTHRMVLVVLGTALRRGELLALRWCDVELGERRVHVRRSWVRNQMTTPKSRASRRTVHFGLKTSAALEEQWKASRYKGDEDLVFGHPDLGTPVDPSELTRSYVKPALKKAGIVKPIQPWHGLRHTALTMDAAVGNPNAYVQAKAGHSQFSITERYIHAAQVEFAGAADLAEARMFGE